MSNEPVHCPSCRQPLPEGAPEGFCPACLWQGLFADTPVAVTAPMVDGPFATLRLPGLTVLEEVARGGMGIVYRARQHEPERDVALKMLLPHQVASAGAKERFRAEARAIAALDHPGILPVHQVGESDGLPWFTMKLASGGSLAQRRSRFAGDWRGIAQLVAQLADAIQFAHDRGILHRDLKPGNILFDDSGQAYVSDFGLAKFLDADVTLTTSRALLGTPGYLAPELLLGTSASATTAADVYGLGALLYELLFSRPPFEAPTLAVLLKQVTDSSPAFADATGRRAPRDLEIICRKCLEKDPARRYAAARELAADLRRWLEGRPILARPAPLAEVAVAWVKRNPVVAALGSLLALALLAGGVALSLQNRSLTHALAVSESAQRAEQASLRAALISRAKALNQTTQAGKRAAVLASLREAAALPLPLGATNDLADLRTEAATALAGFDVVREARWPVILPPETTNHFLLFTPALDRYLVAHDGVTDVRTVAINTLVARLPADPRPPPNNLTLSRDGRLLAVLTRDQGVTLWDLATTNRLFTDDAASGDVLAVDIHPDNSNFALVRRRGGIERRRLDGELIFHWPVTNAVAVRFNHVGGRIAVVTQTGVEVWHTNAPLERVFGTEIQVPVHRVEWHPRGTSLLAASRQNNLVQVVDVFRGTVLAVHPGHGLDGARFDFHPSGDFVASVGREGSLSFWDPRTGRDLVTLPASVDALGFSADGRRLGQALTELDLATLSLQTSAVFHAFGEVKHTGNPAERLLVTADGRELFTLNGGLISRWDARTRERIEPLSIPGKGRLPLIALPPDGQHLIYGWAGEPGWKLALTNLQPAASNPPVRLNATVLDINAAGDWLIREPDGTIGVWPAGDEARREPFGKRLGDAQFRLSPDRRWAASSLARERRVRIANLETHHTMRVGGLTNVFRPTFSSAWFAPDGQQVLIGTAVDFHLLELGTWKRGQAWRLAQFGITGSAAFSPDGKLMALELEHDVFHLIEVASGQTLLRLRPPIGLAASAAAFSPDGTKLYVAGDGPNVAEWDLAALRAELARLGLDW